LTFPFNQLGSKRWCRELTEITDVTLIVGWATVVLAERVKVGSGGGTSVATDQLGRSLARSLQRQAYVLSPNSLRMLAINRGKEGNDVLNVESSLGISIEVLDLQSSVAISQL
jgi:hypothetical protein